MGKWGEEKEINGVTILPHVVTDPFKKIEPNDIIDYLQPISTFLTFKKWQKCVKQAEKKYVNKPYSDWEAL